MKNAFYFFVIILFTGCGKTIVDPPESIYNHCQITKSYSSGDTLNNSTNFSYDNQDRITQINLPPFAGSAYGMYFSYQSNTVKVTDLSTSSYTIYYLGTDGNAIASASYNNGIQTDTVGYLYESGFLKKVVRNNYVFGKDSSFLTYSGNNLSLIKTYTSNGAIEQASFEYNITVSKDWYYENFAPYLHFSMYYPWLGKTNENLIKSYSYTYNGNPSPVNQTYILNGSGYVTRVSMLYLGTTSYTNYEYSCN